MLLHTSTILTIECKLYILNTSDDKSVQIFYKSCYNFISKKIIISLEDKGV